MMMRPAVVVVVDTLTYDEALSMTTLLYNPCKFYTSFWGLSPFTMPAMATIVSGLKHAEHGLWRRGSVAESRRACNITESMGTDWSHAGGAFAYSGDGYANGPMWGYDFGFESWKIVGDTPTFDTWVRREGLTFIHTYEIHNYVAGLSPQAVHRLIGSHPWEGQLVRNDLIRKVERKLITLLRTHPNHDIWVTSDHGEGHAHPLSGHGPPSLPYDRLLHLPLMKFSPDIAFGNTTHDFHTQDQLRYMVRGETVSPAEDAEVEWPFDQHDAPQDRKLIITPLGVR